MRDMQQSPSGVSGVLPYRALEPVSQDTSAPRRFHSPVLGLELDRLHLEELLEAELAELAPVARLLVAAERRERVERRAVDLDLPGADPSRDGLGPVRVA